MHFLFRGWVRSSRAMAAGGSLIALAARGADVVAPATAAPVAAAKLAQAPEVMEGPFFEVAAPDYASAQTVLRMTQRMQENLARYFTWPDVVVRAIQVQMVPAEQANFKAPFLVQSEPDGHRIALVRWDAETKFSDVCLAISSAALEQLADWQNGHAAAARVPDWLKVAFGMELLTSLKPVAVDDLVEQAGRLPSLALRQIMTARGPYGDALPVLEVNAYWLARFLRQECADMTAAKTLFRALAAGTAPDAALRAAFPDQFPDPQTMELWWAVGYHDMVAGRGQPIQAMAQTRALLDNLQAIVVELGGHDQRVGLEAAWEIRTSPRARVALQEQLKQARAALPWSNPVYYNTVWSLAACLETLQHDDKKAYDAAWKRYTDDRAKAEATEYQVIEAMAAK